MYIEVIKDHVAGLTKGQFAKATPANADNLIKEGIAKKANEEDFLKWKEKWEKESKKNPINKSLEQMTFEEVQEVAKKNGIVLTIADKKSESGTKPKTKNQLVAEIEKKNSKKEVKEEE